MGKSKDVISVTGHQLPSIFSSNSIDEQVHKNLFEFFRDKEGFSENTWKMLMSVTKQWARWCQDKNVIWFPADPENVRDYLLEMQEDGKLVKTMRLHLQMLNMLHKRAGLPKPSDSNSVSLVMRRIGKENNEAGEQTGQAIPFNRRDLDKLIFRLEGSPDLHDMRELAVLGIAYNTLLRISEISRIRIKDITWSDEGRMQIRVGRTKTMISAAGIIKTLSLQISQLVGDWIDATGLNDDPENYLFCRIHRSGTPQPSSEKALTTKSIEGIFAKAYERSYGRKKNTGERYQAWSGHSARVGATQDMAKAGVPVAEITQAGGWSNVDMVMLYIRNLESESGAMVRILED